MAAIERAPSRGSSGSPARIAATSWLVLVGAVAIAGCRSDKEAVEADSERVLDAATPPADSTEPIDTSRDDPVDASADDPVDTSRDDEVESDAFVASDVKDGGDACPFGCCYECSEVGETDCEDPHRIRICGNFDEDECLEWGPSELCPADERCYEFIENATTGATRGECAQACGADSDCEGFWWGELCDTSTERCTGCFTDADCADHVFGPVCAEWGRCTACLTDEDCTSNPRARGPDCVGYERKRCGCDSDEDCVGNPFGPHCSRYGSCGCWRSSECGGETPACQYLSTEERWCAAACAGDDDCPGSSMPVCNPDTRLCAECLQDEDCPKSAPHCHQDSGRCVTCVTGADCLEQSPWLGVCEFYNPNTSQCVQCRSDGDCRANPLAEGGRCEGSWCTCATDADCEGAELGDVCVDKFEPGWGLSKMCSCSGDSACTSLPDSECLPHTNEGIYVSAETPITVCRVPCDVDPDCSGESLARVCDTSERTCVVCLEDADCKAISPPHGLCLSQGCFQCRFDDADCAANPDALGPRCIDWDTGPPTCGCFDDAECAGNPNGTRCIGNMCACDDDASCSGGKTCQPYAFAPFYVSTCQ